MIYRIAYIEREPYIMKKESGKLDGYLIKFLDIMTRLDHFNVTLKESSDNTWGKKLKNNNWNGVLGMLQRDEADFSITPTTLNRERYNEFDSTIAFITSTSKILFGTRSKTAMNIYSVVDLRVVLIMVVCCVVLYYLGRICNRQANGKTTVSWTYLIQCLLGTTPVQLKCVGKMKLPVFLWAFLSNIILVYVSSYMTSEFSTKTEDDFINRVKDIPNFVNVKPVLIKGSATTSFVEKNAKHDEDFDYIMRSARSNPELSLRTVHSVLESDDVLSLVESRRLYIISTEISLGNFIKKRYSVSGTCRMKLSDSIKLSTRALFFRKNFSTNVIASFNKRLRRLVEGNCFEDLDPALKLELHPCSMPADLPSFAVLNSRAFWKLFRICTVGFVSASIVLIFEMYRVYVIKQL